METEAFTLVKSQRDGQGAGGKTGSCHSRYVCRSLEWTRLWAGEKGAADAGDRIL